MTALAFEQASKTVGVITGLFPHHGVKSVKAYQKIICVTTDIDSANQAKELFNFTLTLKSTLPDIVKNEDIEFIKKSLVTTNDLLNNINKVLETLKNLFQTENATIEIDDDNMIEFMNSFKESQENMIYISDFFTLALQVEKSKQEIKDNKFQEYTLEQLISYIAA